MSELQEAISLLNETNEKLNHISDEFSKQHKPEESAEVNRIYETTAQMNVLVSQLSEVRKVYEGPCIVDNACATVTIEGFTIRGNVQFEILINGEWMKGHRSNSQYGQVFLAKQGASVILSTDTTGRVRLPLMMD